MYVCLHALGVLVVDVVALSMHFSCSVQRVVVVVARSVCVCCRSVCLLHPCWVLVSGRVACSLQMRLCVGLRLPMCSELSAHLRAV